MFGDTLLESSSTGRKRKRWPMTLAFILEAMVGAALIALPLLSTGVIPVSAHVSIIAPLGRPNATRPPNGNATRGGVAMAHSITLDRTGPCFSCKHEKISEAGDNDNSQPPTLGWDKGARVPDFGVRPSTVIPEQEQQQKKRIRVSEISEGQLIHKVEPMYPRIAIISGVKGDVRLHAIIGKDGTIQSLSVVSGPALLITAARDAVGQWRYRPYLLNGQPVEVETFITVSFKGTRD